MFSVAQMDRGTSRACSQKPGAGVACLNGSAQQERKAAAIPLYYRGGKAGTVVACCANSFAAVAESLRHIIDLALRRIEQEQEDHVLRADLGTSGAKLDSFYDIISCLRAARAPKEVLDHILAKIGKLEPELRAILWLVNDGQLEAAAWKNTSPPAPRESTHGLIGTALAAPQRIVISDPLEIASRTAIERELALATSLAIFPLVTRQGVIGALEVWQESSPGKGGVLDGRLIHLLETLGYLAGMVIENDRLERSHLESEGLQRDIEIASRIQQTLLVGQPPLDLCT